LLLAKKNFDETDLQRKPAEARSIPAGAEIPEPVATIRKRQTYSGRFRS
jgi:hypothetical protein